jgi:hypothetical protein
LWQIARFTCMQNVGAWRMLGECSTRCHLEMWSDVWGGHGWTTNWYHFYLSSVSL